MYSAAQRTYDVILSMARALRLVKYLPDLPNYTFVCPPHTPLGITSKSHPHPCPSVHHLSFDPASSTKMHLVQSVRKQRVQHWSDGSRFESGSYKDGWSIIYSQKGLQHGERRRGSSAVPTRYKCDPKDQHNRIRTMDYLVSTRVTPGMRARSLKADKTAISCGLHGGVSTCLG